MRYPIILFILLAFSSNVVFAQTDDTDAATPGPEKCARIQASTVFVPDKGGNRKKGSASNLTESHRNAEAQGWDFSALSVYLEDGDLQGFFVTYTRPHPCNNK